MGRLIAIFIAGLFAFPCLAQIQATPRTIQKISDPTMLVEDRGTSFEVLPLKRAVQRVSASGREVVHHVVDAEAQAPIKPGQLGVVFNHTLQVHGYISGDIAFKMKGNLQATRGFDRSSYPGLAKLTAPNVYVVRARTPAEFVAVIKRLRDRSDVEWVEPIVTYGRLDGSPSAQ